MARRFVVIPAAGSGSRFGGGVAKQYADLGGAPLLARTIERLQSVEPDAIVVALAPDDREFERRIGARSGVEALRCGGATRAQTVRNALAALSSRCTDVDWILTHDAARPCVPRSSLRALLHALGDDAVGGLLAVPVADTLKRSSGTAGSARVTATQDRDGLWQAQTPQMFRYGLLTAALAHAEGLSCTDEAQAIEALSATGACAMPRLVPGSPQNIKVTYPEDVSLAAAILHAQMQR